MKTLALPAAAAATLALFLAGAEARAADLAACTALAARVDRFDAQALPPHPRLLLNAANLAHLHAAAATADGREQVQSLLAWMVAEDQLPAPPDPDVRSRGKNGQFDVAAFRRIQNLAEEVENHIVGGAVAYRLTGDERCFDLTRRWTLAAAGWNPAGASGIKADDYAARQTLSALAIAYDGLFEKWTPEERRIIRQSLTARAAALYAHLHPFKLDEFNNHPWFQCSALIDGGLALADELPAADGWWRYGADLYFTRFLPLWGRDGDWHEGISYFTFTMKYICQFANSLQAATGINPFELPELRRAGYFRLYAAPPKVRGIYFDDTRPLAEQGWDKPIAYRLAGETQDPVLQWYADWLPPITAFRPSVAVYLLLYHDRHLGSERPPATLPLTRYYRDSGWVIARGDLASNQDIEFGFKSTPWSGTELRAKGHDHPDANNFLLNDLGEPLLVDSGYYDYYSSPHHKGWTFTGKAHNTLLIDGQEQIIRRPGRIVSAVSEPGRFDWMEGEGAEGYPAGLLQGWRRQVLFIRPDLFIIRDLVQPGKPATITWLLHGAAPFALNGQAFSCRNGAAAVTGEIAAPSHLQVRQWTGFPPEAEPERKKPSDWVEFPDESHLEFTTAEKVPQATFITVFRPFAADHPVSLHATVAAQDGRDTVTLDDGGSRPLTVIFAPVPPDGRASPPPTLRR